MHEHAHAVTARYLHDEMREVYDLLITMQPVEVVLHGFVVLSHEIREYGYGFIIVNDRRVGLYMAFFKEKL